MSDEALIQWSEARPDEAVAAGCGLDLSILVASPAPTPLISSPTRSAASAPSLPSLEAILPRSLDGRATVIELRSGREYCGCPNFPNLGEFHSEYGELLVALNRSPDDDDLEAVVGGLAPPYADTGEIFDPHFEAYRIPGAPTQRLQDAVLTFYTTFGSASRTSIDARTVHVISYGKEGSGTTRYIYVYRDIVLMLRTERPDTRDEFFRSVFAEMEGPP